MISKYHRPKNLDEALKLLAQPNTFPLGGGTWINTPAFTENNFEVVDLQNVDLNFIRAAGNNLEVGATTTLQEILEAHHLPPTADSALKLESPLNIRNAATLGGTIASCDGRSPFVTALLAMDAKLTIDRRPQTEDRPSSTVYGLGEFLPLRPTGLITKIIIPTNIKFAFEYVSRTPADKPFLCVALAQWTSARTRLAIGGFGKNPILAMDGTEAEGIETAAQNACHDSNDDYASADYRMDVASTLAKRCLESAR